NFLVFFCRWRGSVYKLIWRELLAYLFFYYLINFTYRYVLNDQQRVIFEKIRYYFGNSSESIPMSFVLGFYVSLVVKRWWEQYKLLPWPDNLALFISAAIPGNDERGRLMRRNIVRYAVLAYVITLQRISLRVKRRFPTLQHMVDLFLPLMNATDEDNNVAPALSKGRFLLCAEAHGFLITLHVAVPLVGVCRQTKPFTTSSINI
ncbi:Bestrophin-1, partial [Camponotus floridanus]